jgi:hypothetical protein
VAETAGAAVGGVGVLTLLAPTPPHPHSKALDNTIPVSAVDPIHMTELHRKEI